VSKSPHRSFERITQDDLIRLAQIARADFDALFQRREYSRPYAAACCVYAKALLVITSTVIAAFRTSIYGGFFEAIPDHKFPPRRCGMHDFGSSKFGRNPDDGDSFKGRRVDVIGRSISMAKNETPMESVLRYLRVKLTDSARLLAERPVIVVWPENCFGQIIWNGERVS
jgi:hypothetical protein